MGKEVNWNEFYVGADKYSKNSDFIGSTGKSFKYDIPKGFITKKDDDTSFENCYANIDNKVSNSSPMVNESGVRESDKKITSSYRDFSKVTHCIPKPQKLATFPQKLYTMLTNPDIKGIITWLPHGRAWKILKPKAFEQVVLPRYFKSGKYSSFIRQVNGWGFRRVTYYTYYHEMFLRGMPHLCDGMKRLTKQDMELRKKEGNGAQPNFNSFCSESPMTSAECKDSNTKKNFYSSITKNNDKKLKGTYYAGITSQDSTSKKITLTKVETKSSEVNIALQSHTASITDRESIIRARELRLEAIRRKRLFGK